ncbi:lipase [Purpureocillium lavendulum]|uniref:Carboxylic ester hydrolase n=1 Tax=Purpureocillium lavendulum TaxID=1247861 RepID=A0AB34FNC4_9HYPO|nr:lipase [Purpureocillium lavendulum]
MLLRAALIWLSAMAVGAVSSPSCPQPDGMVDLGYAKHVPTYINTTASGQRVAVYKNIRFAKAPSGHLRFRGPDTKLDHVAGIQNGSAPWGSTDCIASAPSYAPFPGINGTTWGREDCLFLDVYVPEGVRPGDDVPVLHNFYGSAYAFGNKDMFMNPMGLFDHMHRQNGGKFIVVGNNYRMGVSGFTWAADEDMDGNVGMLDCLAATEWTAAHIHKFGGHGKRITVIGQSAGAGIIYYLTVLNGGKGKPLPFQQAFISSPDAPQRRNVTARQRKLFDTVLAAANCTSLACLRSVPEATMLRVNELLINQTPAEGGGGTFGPVLGFGPAPDGRLIPDIPSALLKQGRAHRGLKRLVIGNMLLEGKTTSHDEGMPGYFPVMVRQQMPTASNATVQALLKRYYRPGMDKELAWDFTTDAIFACNAYNLANAMPDTSLRYIMSTPPASHGLDLYYYFYVDEQQTPVEHPELARAFQTKLLALVRGEDMAWPAYGGGRGGRMYNVTDRFEAATMPAELRARCDTLNGFVLDPANGA